MNTEKAIFAGVDYDKTIFQLPPSRFRIFQLPQLITKRGLVPTPYVREGLLSLTTQPNIIIGGVYTARKESRRRKVTEEDMEKWGIQINETFFCGSMRRKLEKLFNDALRQQEDTGCDIRSIVLFDDNAKSVEKRIERLSKKDRYAELIKRFTFVHINPKAQKVTRDDMPGVEGAQIITMPTWKDIDPVLEIMNSSL